jgi:hypothetical protein
MLKVTMLGFEATTAEGNFKSMTIVMQESEDTTLKEVVIIGYGVGKKWIILPQSYQYKQKN